VTVTASSRTLLREVSLEVSPSEIVGVFGPSGAGKTTLFRVLVGEVAPSAGNVVLSGLDVTAMPLFQRARLGLGYLPQTPSVLADLTVRENLAVFEALTRRVRPSVARDGLEVARDVGLSDLLGATAKRLSGGERRRLELARALIASPSVLICDEPFAAVDPRGASHVGSLLRALADAGAAVLVADHHLETALGICDRAVLLLEGEVALSASPEVFRTHPLVCSRYAAGV
jgi:lipopolysaccharide export system ATP-binding protein